MPQGLAEDLVPEVLVLLDRGRASLERGWSEAALDALGRAFNLLARECAASVGIASLGERK